MKAPLRTYVTGSPHSQGPVLTGGGGSQAESRRRPATAVRARSGWADVRGQAWASPSLVPRKPESSGAVAPCGEGGMPGRAVLVVVMCIPSRH